MLTNQRALSLADLISLNFPAHIVLYAPRGSISDAPDSNASDLDPDKRRLLSKVSAPMSALGRELPTAKASACSLIEICLAAAYIARLDKRSTEIALIAVIE